MQLVKQVEMADDLPSCDVLVLQVVLHAGLRKTLQKPSRKQPPMRTIKSQVQCGQSLITALHSLQLHPAPPQDTMNIAPAIHILR